MKFNLRPTILALSALALATGTTHSETPPTPAAHLGRPTSTDFKLANWNEVSSYYKKLADSTKTLRLDTLGKTTEGRDFLIATISSPANLANLAKLKAHAKTLADPRGKTPEQKEEALKEGKVFLVITPAMHSNEVGATEMAMDFVYKLATSNAEPFKSARDNAVIFITPTLNPDGLDHITEHYNKFVGTPYETAGLLKLYQLYAGHDNNRDWFMMTQSETRLMSKFMYDPVSGVFPQILWDVHQQGNKRERFFTPPYRDPLNPNLDPAIVAGINLVGTRAVLDMTREGLTGIATGSTYDMWWHGGNRSAPARHNIVGILTEAASANLASPIFQERSDLKSSTGEFPYGPSVNMISPWPGGWWKLKDIAAYELSFGRSLLGSINREPRLWKENMLAAAQRAIAPNPEGVKYWIIPADNQDTAAVRRLVDALLLAGIEIRTASAPITIGQTTYPQGSIVIYRDQPFGAHVKDLFEIQHYPEGKAPYDVAGWTLPMLMGVDRIEVMERPAANASNPLATTAETAVAAFTGDPRTKQENTLSITDSATWPLLVDQLKADRGATYSVSGPTAGLFSPLMSAANTPPGEKITINHLPKIGIYAPWSGSIDEGWLRFVFDTHKVPFTTLRNENIRAGKLLASYDVIIIPDISEAALTKGRAEGSIPDEFTAGLAPEGSVALEEFVRAGGTLITLGSSSGYASKLFQLPLITVTTGDDAKGFACPGSVLRSIPMSSPLTTALPETIPLLFSDGSAFREMTKLERDKTPTSDAKIQTLLRYAPNELLLSGYIAKPSVIEGQSAWVRATYGQGRIHLFGFSPHFRAWTQGTIPLIFRAVFLDTPTAP